MRSHSHARRMHHACESASTWPSTSASAAQNASASPRERHSGGTSRSAVGVIALTRMPALAQRARRPRSTGASASSIAEQQPEPAHVVDARRSPRRARRCARRSCARSRRGPRARSRRARRAPRPRSAGCRRTCVAWSPRWKPSPTSSASSAPIGSPRAEALGEADGVGPHAEPLEREPRAAAADAGLHLVEQQQRVVAVAQRARLGEVLAASSARRRPRPASARPARPRSAARRRRASASRSLRGTCRKPGGHRLEGLALGGATSRRRACASVRPWNARSTHTISCLAGAAARAARAGARA